LFLEACARLGVDPTRTLMVGDSPLDIQMAQTAGAAGAIGICWGTAIAEHLDQADVTIRRLDEITIVD
jgi:phosphoglycolate phosphatase